MCITGEFGILRLPFTDYEKQLPRFMSEYGFQSFPQIETVNTYTLPEDRRHSIAGNAGAPKASARQSVDT